MHVDGKEVKTPINDYTAVNGKVGAMCIGMDLVEFFTKVMQFRGSYLEIGTFDGVALSIYAERMPDKKFHAIDLFQAAYCTGGGNRGYFYYNCHKYENIHLWEGASQEILPKLNQTFDVIFVDGDHSYKAIKEDLFNSWYKLNPGGLLAVHDIDLPSTLQAVSEFEAAIGIKRMIFPQAVFVLEKK